MSDQTFVIGKSQNLRANDFSRTGYTFAGWATSETGSKVYDDKQSVGNLASTVGATVTLYALWEKDAGGDDSLGGVQLWENGPYWAECNVGATTSEEYGYYFWWGDTVGYKRNAGNNGWVSVANGASCEFNYENCPTSGKNNTTLRSEGWIDASGNLVTAHDAATAHLGAPWRMPTNAEWGALINNCDTEWTTRGGVSGLLVKGRGLYSSRSIFLPAAGYGDGSSLDYVGSDGYFWSSTPDSDGSSRAWDLYFYSGGFRRDDGNRYCGQSVRPLRGFAQ